MGHEVDTLYTFMDAYTARVFSIADSVATIPAPEPQPYTYYLDQCYPNPFNTSTIINFGLSDASQVTINIYDVQGRRVAEILNANMIAGTHSIHWNGESQDYRDLPNGVYLYQIKAEAFTKTKKMILLK